MMMVMKLIPSQRVLAWLPQHQVFTERIPRVNEISLGPTVPQWLLTAEHRAERWIGHNCYNFDAPFLVHHYGLKPRWYDTLPAARASGLPGGLDALGKALGDDGKDETGKKIMRLLCQAKRRADGTFVYPVGTPPMWKNLLIYNLRDVELTEKVYKEVEGREEPDVVQVDQAINERGVCVDTDWLTALLRLWKGLEHHGGDRLAVLTGGALTRANAASIPQVKKWLERQGLHLESLNRKSLEAFYEDPGEVLGEAADNAALVVEVLKLRQSLTRAMKGKLETIAESLDPAETHPRARDWSVYHGAHTGRFTSRRIQLHNMSRGIPIDVRAVIERIMALPRTDPQWTEQAIGIVKGEAAHADIDDALATLVRPVFCASPGMVLGIVDYGAVEARGVAWLAGEEWLLEAFNDPTRDVYCEFGSRIFGRTITKKDKAERTIAKVCVLGMGYGMGKDKFALYAKQSGIDLAVHGLTAEGLVAQYRDSCPAIVRLWREVGKQAERAVRHGTGICCGGRVQFHHDGHHLYLTLPSGRAIRYRSCRIERRVPAYCALLGLAPFEKDTLVYRTPRAYDATLYGAKLVENAVQGFCRDFLTDSLVKLEATAFKPVLHVHDEVVTEIPETMAAQGLEVMCEIMSTPPAWADGFPLRVEGFSCPRYVKSPWKGVSVERDYINGKPT
jgi:DNA polymerase